MNFINEVDVGDVFKDARKNIEYVAITKHQRYIKLAEMQYYNEQVKKGNSGFLDKEKTIVLQYGNIDDCVYAEYSLDLSLNIFKGKELIVANTLKEHNTVRNFEGRKFIVVENHIDDVLYLVEDTINDAVTNELNGIHLFYQDMEDVVYAKDVFNIDLKGYTND